MGMYFILCSAYICMILFNTVKSTISNSKRFVLLHLNIIFISEYEMLPTFGERIELSHSQRCHDITTINGSIFRHISKAHCVLRGIPLSHIVWKYEPWTGVISYKPLKIDFYNRKTNFSLIKIPISSLSFLYAETSYQMHDDDLPWNLAALSHSNVDESKWIKRNMLFEAKNSKSAENFKKISKTISQHFHGAVIWK